MPYLSKKSKENYQAAQLLIEEKQFTPVPHCAYYSCILMMKHILFTFGETDDSIELGRKLYVDNGGRILGTHEVIVGKIKDHVKKLSRYEVRRNFLADIDQLKVFRVQADYKNLEVSEEIGGSSIDLCGSINTFLINSFNIE